MDHKERGYTRRSGSPLVGWWTLRKRAIKKQIPLFEPQSLHFHTRERSPGLRRSHLHQTLFRSSSTSSSQGVPWSLAASASRHGRIQLANRFHSPSFYCGLDLFCGGGADKPEGFECTQPDSRNASLRSKSLRISRQQVRCFLLVVGVSTGIMQLSWERCLNSERRKSLRACCESHPDRTSRAE